MAGLDPAVLLPASPNNSFKMATKTNKRAAMMPPDENDDMPAILSLAEHITPLEDDETHVKRKKSAKKAKRKRNSDSEARLVHQLSDSEDSAEFAGFNIDNDNFLPIFETKKQAKKQKTAPKQRPQVPKSPGWPFQFGSSDSFHDSFSPIPSTATRPRQTTPMPDEEDSESEDEVQEGISPSMPYEAMNSNVSLDDFMNVLNADQDVGPNVWPNVAALV